MGQPWLHCLSELIPQRVPPGGPPAQRLSGPQPWTQSSQDRPCSGRAGAIGVQGPVEGGLTSGTPPSAGPGHVGPTLRSVTFPRPSPCQVWLPGRPFSPQHVLRLWGPGSQRPHAFLPTMMAQGPCTPPSARSPSRGPPARSGGGGLARVSCGAPDAGPSCCGSGPRSASAAGGVGGFPPGSCAPPTPVTLVPSPAGWRAIVWTLLWSV